MWYASAPSNLALIKYMGKDDTASNVPSNSSLSYTLEHLRTFVELEIHDAGNDIWEPIRSRFNEDQSDLPRNDGIDGTLCIKAINRFLNFFKKLKQQFNIQQNFIIRSANNFPADCGLASSASSFAALTQCAMQCFAQLNKTSFLSTEQQAQLSQTASGSSCRSFFSPWSLWTKNSVGSIELPYKDLMHIAVIVDQHEKKISSSEAHKLVASSDLFIHREQRAETRLQRLMEALRNNNWQQCYIIAWQEFWDMHALFETAATPFHYMNEKTLEVLDFGRHYWEKHNDGPIITLDAGPNVHLLFRTAQQESAMHFKNYFQEKYPLFTNM